MIKQTQCLENNEKFYQLGKATFKQSMKDICENNEQAFSFEYLSGNGESFIENNWKTILERMVKSSHEGLNFQCSNQPSLLMQMKHINFTNLKRLFIAENQINNLQPLIFIQSSQIQAMDLKKNKITTIKCLHKLNTKVLDKLNMRGNNIRQTTDLSKTRFNSLVNYIFYQCDHNDQVQGQDLSNNVKIVASQIQALYIQGRYRIHQQKVMQMIKNKYQKVTIA